MSDYDSPVFAAWRAQAGDDWQAYIDHPFVTGLGDGSLPRDVFLTYLIQDYLFLLHYSKAWAMAVVKGESVREMSTAATMVDVLINAETRLHVAICDREGLTEAQLGLAEERPENLAYTRYLMDAGLCGDLLDLLAAVAPCVFGYGEIGLNLTRSHNTQSAYREWIDSYAGGEYQTLCRTVGGLIEQACAARLGPEPEKSPRWAVLCRRFTTATRLEVAFWDMPFKSI